MIRDYIRALDRKRIYDSIPHSKTQPNTTKPNIKGSDSNNNNIKNDQDVNKQDSTPAKENEDASSLLPKELESHKEEHESAVKNDVPRLLAEEAKRYLDMLEIHRVERGILAKRKQYYTSPVALKPLSQQ